MSTAKIKKALITGATLFGAGVLVTTSLRAQKISSQSSGSISFAKAFGEQVKAYFKTTV